MTEILSLGAGVQSSMIALAAACGLIRPMPKAAIFADTGDEPKVVYEWLDWLTNQLPFPVVVVKKGILSEMASRVRTSKKSGLNYLKPGLPMYTLTKDGKRGMMQRQCTLTAKIEPLKREAKKIAGRGEMISMWIGISTDESSRIKPSRDPRIIHRWPLIDLNMSRADCLAWMAEKGFPTPPRSACVYCPYHNDAEWLRIKTESPKEFEKAVTFEKRMQVSQSCCPRLESVPYLHASRVPLDLVVFTNDKTKHFINECEGMCGN